MWLTHRNKTPHTRIRSDGQIVEKKNRGYEEKSIKTEIVSEKSDLFKTVIPDGVCFNTFGVPSGWDLV